jgi:PPK2 family polyphosphate:nucleotide phosphotransferase
MPPAGIGREMDNVAPESPYRVPHDGSFSVPDAPTAPPDETPDRNEVKERLEEVVEELADLEEVLYADNRHAVLCVFQAMDAAGKDSTIRAVTTGINPAGFQVYSFKAPSKEELDHDFLWRTSVRLPERGRIGIFNRSYYEEALVVRVHPGFLESQRLPRVPPGDALWEERFDSIRDHELHLARSGTVILKFWLNVSREEQARRFLRRIDRPDKNWKFQSRDILERRRWDDYMGAYQEALAATSRPWAPWYAIPADDKPFMRLTVAEILRDQLRVLDLRYPDLPDDERAKVAELRNELEGDLEGNSASESASG